MIAPVAGIVLAPLLPGAIQTLKALAQGRGGASPLQPDRTLRRLWGKSAVDPAGSGLAYRVAPALVAACLVAALGLLPTAGRASGLGLGNDAFVLVGLLALARFALAAAAWDTGNGFALMGAARDLALAVFGEALLELLAGPVAAGRCLEREPPPRSGSVRSSAPRGATTCAVELRAGRVSAFRLRTASYANWPAVAHAATGRLLRDFPMINKSFELCYACVDR